MKVPFLDLKRQYNIIKNEVEEAVLKCMESCGYIEGPAVKSFEENMASYLNVKHVITCGSGTDALKIALKASGIEQGDEVITSAFSFFATAEAISAVGAVPVFVDINEEDYNINVDLIEDRITAKTKAILPVHIFGQPVDMDKINSIAHKYDLKVIEDACQAIGSEYKGKKTGTIGTAGCFSFYPTKNLGAFGDGGMITTNDDNIAKVCRALKAHAGGKTGYEASVILGENEENVLEFNREGDSTLYDPYKYYNYLIADNSRLDSIQAVILNVKLKYLDKFNERRNEIADKYNSAFKNSAYTIPEYEDNTYTCWHQYVVTCDCKNELIEYLEKHNVGAGTFYPVPLHLQKAFNDLGYKTNDCPIAERVCDRTVCLPIFPELMDNEIDYIIDIVKEYK